MVSCSITYVMEQPSKDFGIWNLQDLGDVAKIFEVPPSNIFARTDSHVTLGWLQGNPWKFLTFIDNRVAEISEAITVACWHHVNGADNQADCASRRMSPAELVEHELWRRGSQWLRVTEETWNVKVSFDEHPILFEERDVQQTLLPVITADLPLLERISSDNHLVRVTAWILRFVNNARKRSEEDSGPILSLSELKWSEETWWRIAQRSLFEEKIYNLKNGKGLSLKRKILHFHPFLDDQGLLHVRWEASRWKVALWGAPPSALTQKSQGN